VSVCRRAATGWLSLAGLACVLLAANQDARAQTAASCDLSKQGGPVSIVVVASKARVQKYAATVRDVRVVRRDANTVVFADGRVITSNVSAASDHINALGWGSRRIELVATSTLRRPRRRSG
jgi:hypothetical protein